jgi:protein-L-isoaspartate(D-aspartate) O-methyltransferase
MIMDYPAARRKMVENQIRPNRVTDAAIVAAMAELPREAFVPPELRSIAYVDEDVALGGGRYLMEPLLTARLIQAAQIESDDIVLDVGCATGYAAAIIARLAGAVVALESDPGLAERARQTLTELGCETVSVVVGALADGHARQAPYDVIVIEGAIAAVPDAIAAQLAEGGRLVAIINDGGAVGRGALFLRTHGVLSRLVVFDGATPFLPGFEPRPEFRF